MSTNGARPILGVRDLCKSFGSIRVTQSVSFDLRPGARMGLIGPNGAGKTTLINLLTGVLAPDSGDILLDGGSIAGFGQAKRVRSGIVRTHQINTLLRETSALENVALAISERDGVGWKMLAYGKAWRRCEEEAAEILSQMGLADIGDGPVGELPYGQQRLLEIAIAMALKPRVLLLDEPAAGIPSGETRIIHEVVERLSSDVAVVIIEHDMEVIFRFAETILVLSQGQVLASGTPEEISADKAVREAYLGRSAA